MKSEHILSFHKFLNDKENSNIFSLEFPEAGKQLKKIMTSVSAGEQTKAVAEIYDFLGEKHRGDVGMLRTRMGFITSPNDWWLEYNDKRDLTLDILRGVIMNDAEFYGTFSYMQDIIDDYRETKKEQLFNDIVFSFFTNKVGQALFFEFFSKYKLGDEIESKYGYAIL